MNNIKYYATRCKHFNDCINIITTDTKNRILQVLNINKFALIDNVYECYKHKTKHRLGEIFNPVECGRENEDINPCIDRYQLLNFLSQCGNAQAWANYDFRIEFDNDGEAIGVYSKSGKTYSGWVDTIRDLGTPRPRNIELANVSNKNDKIVVVINDDIHQEGFTLEYKGQIAYSQYPYIKDDIERRLQHLLFN